MPTYSVINKVTGEKMTFSKTMKEYTQWREDNPDWERYYTADNAPGFGEVGEWKDKLIKSKPGWNEVLEKAQNAPSARQKFKI